MKILIVMDPGILVPPTGYGGIERMVALLAVEYLRQGHCVDVLASEGSYIEGCEMHIIGKAGFPPEKRVMNRAVLTAWEFLWLHRSRYDLIHNFGRLLYFLPVLLNRVKKLMCYQREISTRNIKIITAAPRRNLIFSGCSNDLVKRANAPGVWAIVHNALDFSQFSFSDKVAQDAPLIFLGRIERIKGCHTAIKLARATGKHLIIAGNVPKFPRELEYFEMEDKT